MDRQPQCTVESWLAEALASTPLPPGVSSRELVRRAVNFDRPPRLPYALIMPVYKTYVLWVRIYGCATEILHLHFEDPYLPDKVWHEVPRW